MEVYYRQSEAPVEQWLYDAGVINRKKGERKKKHGREIINLVTAFDIETSLITCPMKTMDRQPYHSFMYVWQYAFGMARVILGRSWEEYKELCQRIKAVCMNIMDENKYPAPPLLITYVQNLSYEFQFLSDPHVYNFSNDECFFRKSRRPLYVRMHDCMEYRCSYLQSNMSLEKFAEYVGARHRKESGLEFDYHKIRFPWTELSEQEIKYCVADVVALVESITLEMKRDGDTLRSIPLTSTGYVRRECAEAIRPIRKEISGLLPDEDQYKLLRKAMRGGNTHANRFHVGRILGDVDSYDMVSCYPAQQCTKTFPMKRFQWLEPGSDLTKRAMRYIFSAVPGIREGYAVVGEYYFRNIRLRNFEEPVPYISIAKCDVLFYDEDEEKEAKERMKGRNQVSRETLDEMSSQEEQARARREWKGKNSWERAQVDNGRLLCAPFVRMWLTEIDLEIICRQYSYDNMECVRAMVAEKAMLPAAYRNQIMNYYRAKTELKGIPGKEYEYEKSKNRLNSIYGMSAQDPIHSIISYHVTDSDGVFHEYLESDYDTVDVGMELAKVKFPYQWGVYTTAYARLALQEGIDHAGKAHVYSDTDSNKVLAGVSYALINKKRRFLAIKHGAHAVDKHGTVHYMGVYEKECRYDRFVTMGSKKYAFEKPNKNGVKTLGITVAGLSHKKDVDGEELCVKCLGTLDKFREGMVWEDGGGKVGAVYNDNDDFEYTDPDSGRTVHIGKNVALVPCSYELGYGHDYKLLLFALDDFREWRKKHE